jgi:membrane-bound ClpP family serine protease
MDKKLLAGRAVIAVITNSLEEAAIYAVWRWLLPDAGVHLPVWVLVVVMAAWLGFSVWLFNFTNRYLKRQPSLGFSSMVGTTGKAAGPLAPEGMVSIGGELWGAVSVDGKIRTNEAVLVVGQENLKLMVKKVGPSTEHPSTGSG